MKRLCLNMIVRNEADKMLRALESVKDHIATFAIFDTGSTDGTPNVIIDWGTSNGISGVVAHGAFINFEQARNQALSAAHDWLKHPHAPKATHLLLMDADMELRATEGAFDDLGDAEALEMLQYAHGMSYNNVRLLRAGSPARYVGVTHEFLSVPSGGLLKGAHFVDHADGNNRGEKIERDIRLLEADLKRDPANVRTWFYLANTYRDAGRHEDAAKAYAHRVELGGWDEEVWHAQHDLALELKAMGKEDEFVIAALKAHEMRPQRGETLLELSKYYRERGDNRVALLFAERGLPMPRPDDKLFVSDWVYEWGLKFEYAVAGYYSPDTRSKAYRVNNSLGMDLAAPGYIREACRRNMVFYLPKLADLCPSAHHTRIIVEAKPGFVAMNPCITSSPQKGYDVLLRTVNYRIDEQGRYMIGPKQCGDAPIETENLLLRLDENLTVTHTAPVIWDRPPAKFPLVIGLEDMRIYWRHGGRWFLANVREQREDGQCVQYNGQLTYRIGDGGYAVVACENPVSDGTQTEKNWAPYLSEGYDDKFVYRLDTMGALTVDGVAFAKTPRSFDVSNISGSSQWVRFNGGMLAIVHEAVVNPGTGKRVYQHRFAWSTPDFSFLKLSLPFVFQDVQIEFCAGLAVSPDNRHVIASYGLRDEEAWLCKIAMGDVLCMLGS